MPLRVYLDTKDLIEILERDQPVPLHDLDALLRAGGHSIVVSQVLIGEIASPLLRKDSRTNVMEILNRLETLPLSFIQHGSIVPREIRAAIAAYATGNEPEVIDPYVNRFDEALTLGGRAVTRHFINPGIAELVFMVFTDAPESLRIREQHVAALRELMLADRALPRIPPPRLGFRIKMRRTLPQHGIELHFPVDELSDWIFEKPSRCPYLRLGFELYHAIRANTGDRTEDSTLADILHANLLPYLDLQTLDRRMRTYIRQVDGRLRTGYAPRVRATLVEILPDLDATVQE